MRFEFCLGGFAIALQLLAWDFCTDTKKLLYFAVMWKGKPRSWDYSWANYGSDRTLTYRRRN